METLINDPNISKFLSNYPTEYWISILKLFANHSINSITAYYSGQCPTLEKVYAFFEEASNSANLINEMSDLYTNLHKVDKKLRKIMKRSSSKRSYSVSREKKTKNKLSLNIPECIFRYTK